MPILDVTISSARPEGWARPLADALAPLWPGEATWVRMHSAVTAGAGATAPALIEVRLPALPRDLASLAGAITDAAARAMFLPSHDVHVLFEAIGGRLAIGGTVIAPPPPTRTSTGAKWEAIVGYCRAVRTGSHVAVTGTVSIDPQGRAVQGDAYEQAAQCLATIEAALGAVGARLEDVVRTRMYVVDIERDWMLVGKAHGERFVHHPPATTMVQVGRLIEPWMLVEIEADAFVAPGRAD